LQKAAFRSEAELYNDFSIEPLTQTLENLTEQFSNNIILRAVYGNRIVGSVRAYCDGENVHIGKLIVDPQLQGQGIAKQLMKAIESEFGNNTFILNTGHKSVKNNADLILLCNSSSLAFHNSVISAMFLADFMISSIAINYPEKIKNRLDRVNQILTQMNYHHVKTDL